MSINAHKITTPAAALSSALQGSKLGSDAIDTQLINSDTAGTIRYPGVQLVQLNRRQLLQPSGQGDGEALAVGDCVDDTVTVTLTDDVMLAVDVTVTVNVDEAVNVDDLVRAAD